MVIKPEFIEKRLKLWDLWKVEYDEFVSKQERVDLTVTLKDGSILIAKAWETSPYLLIRPINQSMADEAVIAKVNGVLWDLDRPLESDCTLELLNFEDKEGQYVFWHSSAHILGEAMELEYSGHLCYGPPVEEGFYYDIYMQDRQVKPDEYKSLEDKCKRIVKEKQKFDRLEVSIEQLLEMFDYNDFKCRILRERVKTAKTTIYRCGDLIDLCVGPHVRNTAKVKAMAVTKNSASYWEGDATKESLQRIYGISFPDPKQLKEWKTIQEEAAKRDHRKIGTKQQLFMFHELSPGSCFFLPNGTFIYNKLIDYMKSQYWKRGFKEVISPNMYNSKLWEISGHWEHYSDNMFQTEIEKAKFALKPMNCPGHCLMFGSTIRSYKDLPIRFADFGVLHRNEASGALSGLTRVRRFQQDDAHIFCREDQITQEIESCLDFLKCTYEIFGFDFHLKLSTRPDKFLGEVTMWDKAESQLTQALENFGKKWELNPGDGAFYGPKIDITITDALKRHHQCATIQLDFQLPQRFELEYMTDSSAAVEGDCKSQQLARPVIIHRAILGSVERMFAILTENYGGKWPFWLSPFQAIVVPFNPACDEYALKIQKAVHDAGFHCDIDLDTKSTFNKKISKAQESQFNFMLIIGKKEIENGTVNVRTRDNKVHGEHQIEHIIDRFKHLDVGKFVDAEKEF